MKLPTKKLENTFKNAPGSNIEKVYALAARENPDDISEMATSVKEVKALEKEALARQYVIIVDKSGSMGERDGEGTRWDSARKAVENMIDVIFTYDIDHSVPLYLFDTNPIFIGEVTKPGQVLKVFREYHPGGTTGLGKVLKMALETYAGTNRPNYEVVPGTTFIVLLDGGADDPEEVYNVLKYYADPNNGYVTNHTQIAVSFVQIGDDKAASDFLKRLDDDIEPDIADFKKDDILYTNGGLDKLLYDAIFD